MMQAHFQELKGQMNKLREDERERLTKLTLDSNNTLKELKGRSDKASECITYYASVSGQYFVIISLQYCGVLVYCSKYSTRIFYYFDIIY